MYVSYFKLRIKEVVKKYEININESIIELKFDKINISLIVPDDYPNSPSLIFVNGDEIDNTIFERNLLSIIETLLDFD